MLYIIERAGVHLVMSPDYFEIGYIEEGYGHFIQGNYSLSLQAGNMYFFPMLTSGLQGRLNSKSTDCGKLKSIRFLYIVKEVRMAAPLLPMKWMVEQQHREQCRQLFNNMLSSVNDQTATIPTE